MGNTLYGVILGAFMIIKFETLPHNRGWLVDDFIVEFSGLVYRGGKQVKYDKIPPHILEARERLFRDER